jgi:hypothetical protein
MIPLLKIAIPKTDLSSYGRLGCRYYVEWYNSARWKLVLASGGRVDGGRVSYIHRICRIPRRTRAGTVTELRSKRTCFTLITVYRPFLIFSACSASTKSRIRARIARTPRISAPAPASLLPPRAADGDKREYFCRGRGHFGPKPPPGAKPPRT